jgi:hypothetical protein
MLEEVLNTVLKLFSILTGVKSKELNIDKMWR